MSGKNIIIILVAVIVLGGLGTYFSSNTKGVTVQTSLTDTDWKRGAINPRVTLIEYGDFQCPACATYEPIVQKLQEDFKDDIVFSYRHFPLSQIHQNAIITAKASEAAGKQNKFWEMHDLLYKMQNEWASVVKSRETVVEYAKKLGLDVSQFSQDIDLESISDKIKQDYEGGLKLGVQGTPTFFLNGKKIDNPRSYEDFKKLIESAK